MIANNDSRRKCAHIVGVVGVRNRLRSTRRVPGLRDRCLDACIRARHRANDEEIFGDRGDGDYPAGARWSVLPVGPGVCMDSGATRGAVGVDEAG